MFTLNLHIFFFIFTIILLLFEASGPQVVLNALVLAVIEIYLWAKRENRAGRVNWFHPVPVFVLGYCIVYYQLPFCYLAGFDLSYHSTRVIFAPENISYCVLLATLGLASFFCGEQIIYLKTVNNALVSYQKKYDNNPFKEKYSFRVKIVNNIVLLLALAFYILNILSIGMNTYFGFNYGVKQGAGGFSNYFEFIYTILMYLAILLEISKLVNESPKSFKTYFSLWNKKVLIFTFITIVPYLISGDRGSYLQPLALIFAPYFILVKPLSFFRAGFFVVGLAFILVLVGDTRSAGTVAWRDAFLSRIEAVNNPARWPTMELANSFGTFNIATYYFPERYQYNNGINTIYRISAIIPYSSVFTEIEKKNKQNDYKFTSGLFFTNILTRGTFSSGSGTSSLADVFMDFGPSGIPVVLFLWGLLMSYVAKRANMKNSAIYMFLFSYYSYFGIYVNRSSFFFGWNQFLWVILMFIIIRRLYFRRIQI